MGRWPLILAAAACAPAADPWVDEADFTVEIGTGAEAFVPLADGDPLPLERGAQGLQHVLTSARAPVPEGRYPVAMWLLVDGEAVSAPSLVSTAMITDGASAVTLGRTLVIPDVTGVVDAEATLRVELTDGARVGRGAVSGVVTWVDR